MARSINKLSAAKVKSPVKPGIYEDGGGLRLIVEDDGRKSWATRPTINGKRVMRRLGTFPMVSLEEARAKAAAIRKAAKEGVDLRAEEKRRDRNGITFREMFDIMFEQRKKQLSNAKHLAQWPSSMEAYVFPKIGELPVANVSPAHVIEVLKPIWYDKPETGKRVLQRIGTVFEAAIVREIRERANPCTGVAKHLGTKHRDAEHHAAMPWQDVPKFVAFLRTPSPKRHPVTPLCLEFLILTAARSGEARGALWSEIDMHAATWTIPAERMKARAAHRVPLSPRCLEILREARKLAPKDATLVFPSRLTGRELSDATLGKVMKDEKIDATAHGFRSSFKVWAAETANVPHEISESVLAHANPSKVVAAYLRTDFFAERRPVMGDWARYCGCCG